MDSYIQDRYGAAHDNGRTPVGDMGQDYPPVSSAQQSRAAQLPNQMPNQIQQFNTMRDRLHAARMQRGAAASGGRFQRGQQQARMLKQWNDKCQIQNITIPQLINSATCSQRFRITLTWIDQTGRPHQQDINFGEQGQQQFIDHRDTTVRDARLAQLKQQTLINPLHPNFWQFHLLNKYPDINVAYFKFIQDNNLTARRVVLKKQFRRQSETQFAAPARTKLQPSNSSLQSTAPSANSYSVQNQIQNDLMNELQNNYRYGNTQY